MKNFITNFIVFSLILLAPLRIYSQEIEIDSTFNSSFEIFPFEQIENISGITMEGIVHLNCDTSLVRVILEDDNGFQYMIFETYPLICPDSYINFSDSCDETCFLDQVNPYSIIIQVIDATLNLKSFYYSTDPKENAAQERYNAKRAADADKIETMNQLIPSYNMNWIAGDNSIVADYYDQKRNMFGDGYNLRGYDYYSGGVFEFLGQRNYPKVNPDFVRSFDWRNRHGANDPLSLYWDGDDTLGTGWLTKSQSQWPCGTCWAFSSAGVVEAIANLYSARHINYDLSEQDLVSCSGAGNCWGGNEDTALLYIKYHGTVTENCFPYQGLLEGTEIPCDSNFKCVDPDTIIRITDTLYYLSSYGYNYDSLRIKLIAKGPLTFNYEESPLKYHAVVLFGFEFVQQDSTLYWIIKNSNTDWGDRGFGKLKLENYIRAFAVIPPIFHNDTALEVECHDYDHDGYCFWGIGDKPVSCDSCNCSEIEDCDDNDSLVGGYDENYNCTCLLEIDSVSHHIITDTNWSDSIYVNYDVIIDSGACLTISSYAAFAPNAGILVSQGAELIIDGGYLTKACPDLWDGIEVWGSDTNQYYDEYFGKLVMKNDAVIEFAKVGVANYCTLCDYNFMHSGGIILAENSTFRDNETDVQFAPFSNLWFGNEIVYFGVFEKCEFITTDNFYPAFIPKAHVEMKDVYGVRFYGCVFKNESALSVYPYSLRGTGISSIDADFLLHEYCNNPNIIPCNDLDSCKFISLEYGIKALNCISVRTLYIRNVIFESNLIGISLSGIDNALILSNDFNCPKKITSETGERFKGGLFMEGCTGYRVERNYFHALTEWEIGVSPAYGIGIKNSGPYDNEIYNNTFYRLETGIISIGENRGNGSGLCLKCNDMSRDTNDFIVVEDEDPPLGVYQGINKYQGNPKDSVSYNAPAGNTFSFFNISADSTDVKYYNYLNAAEDIWYVHHYSEFDLVAPLDGNYTKETIELMEQNIQYVKSTACPSSGNGGDSLKSYTSPRLNILEADNHIALLTNQLSLLVDGGSTEDLNFEVMTSMPDEGLEIRQQLLSESPYLSDTVLKQAIYKEDVLPNAMIRDILDANPQSAKTDDVLNTLDDRFEPMPDYMMAQIMEGKEYLGAKELLEADIQSWKQFRAKAKAELFRQFLLDTIMVSPLDSVIAFLETENDLKSRYDLAFAYWNKLDSANAMLTINNIPLQFTLNDNQNTVHQQYMA